MQFHAILINGSFEWGITSRELAQFLGRRHNKILRDIRVFLSRKSLSYGVFNFEEKTYRKNGHWPEYVLTKRAAEEFLSRRQVRRNV